MTTYSEVFAVPAFRILFVSRSLAIGADTLRIVALSVLVYTLTGSPLLSAITFGIGFLPQVLGGMLLGSLADRLRPRPLIACGYLLECAAALALAAIAMPIGASLAIVAAIGALMPVFGGASSRVIADVLTGDAYVLGRSVSGMAAGAAQVVGLAFGGLAIGAIGPRRALLAAAACHAIAALIVHFGLPSIPPVPPGQEGGAVRQSWVVNARLLADRETRRLLLVQWLPPAFVVGAESLVVAYSALRGFPAGAAGTLMACMPAGMLLGNLVIGRFVAPATRTRLVAPLIALLGGPAMALALDPPQVLAGGLLLLCGAGFGYTLGIQKRFLDALPEAGRGQAFGLLSMGLMTMQGIGPLVFGAVAQGAGIRAAMVAAGGAALVSAIVWGARERGATPVSEKTLVSDRLS